MSTPTPRTSTDNTTSVEQALRTALRDIAAYWPDMIQAEATSRPNGTIGRSAERVDPIHAHILDVRLQTLVCLNAWTYGVLTERGLPGNGLDRNDALGLARFLDTHAPWIAAQPAGPTAATQLSACARQVHGIARPSRPDDEHFVGPCPCGQRLHATRDTTDLTCPTCSRTTSRHHIRNDALDVVRDQLCTPRSAETIGSVLRVHVKRKTISTWERRGKIQRVDTSTTGEALYRWADIENLASTQ